MEKKEYLIKEIISSVEDVKIFRLTPKKDPISYKSGQFVKLESPEPMQDPKFRFYSIASAPHQPYLEFCIKIQGKFTNYLNSLSEGDTLLVEGPYGYFSYSDESKCLFISGGIGVAPILSILRHIIHNKIKGDFVFIDINRYENVIPYYEELKKLKQDDNSINVIFSLTREKPRNEGWEHGHITEDSIKRCSPDVSEKIVYMCGPVRMITSVKEILIKSGAKEENIKFEAWG